jgi:hypothetical protein
MAKRTDKNILPKNNSAYEERLMVLVENLGDQIKLVAEDNLMTREIMERGFERIDGRFESMENRMDRIEVRLGNLEAKVDNLETKVDSLETKVGFLEKDTRDSHKTVIEYLSRIEGELAEIKAELRRLEEKKADKEILAAFEKRIIKIEREIAACKNCRRI